MRFKVQKGDLDTAMQVANIASGSDDNEYSGHFLIRIRNGQVELLGANASRQMAGGPLVGAEIIEGTDGMAFTVVAWRLRILVQTMKARDEVLDFHYEDGVTRVQTRRGSGKLGSLDPKTFPVIDKILQDAKVLGEMDSSRLTNIFSYARQFVSDQETRNPHIVAIECRNSVLHATDSIGIVQVESPLLTESGLRVHGKDVPALLAFLAFKGAEKVTLLEHDTCLIVRRADQYFLAIGRWPHEFPNLNVSRDMPAKCWFSLPTEDVKEAIQYLGAFAKKDDNHLRFRFDAGKMVLSMESASGDNELADQFLDCVEHEGMGNLSDFGSQEIVLSKKFVGILVGAQTDGQPIRFQVGWINNKGFVFSRREEAGDLYFTLIICVRQT